MQIQRAGGERDVIAVRSFVRISSPLTPVIDALTQVDSGPDANESFIDWVAGKVSCDDFDRLEFELLYRLHLQMRYDPDGLSPVDVARLRVGAEKYLQLIVKHPG